MMSTVDPAVIFIIVAAGLFLIGALAIRARSAARRRKRARRIGLTDFGTTSVGSGAGSYAADGSWSGDSWGGSGDLGGDSGGDGGGGGD